MYMGSKEITNTLNIANEDPGRIKVIAASTPSGKHEEFYNWCTNAKTSLRPTQDDIDNFKFSGYITEKREKGNGWTEIYSPSMVNKKILDINPDTKQTYLQDIKEELTEQRYEQEVMANFGDEEMGVYSHRILEMAYNKGLELELKYFDDFTDDEKAQFFLNRSTKTLVAAVDWDLATSTPNILCLCYDKLDKAKYGHELFKVLFRVDIPRTKFTLDTAVQTLIDLDKKFNFDYVSLDRGLGEYQVETVKKYGLEHPETGLHLKTKGYHFGEKLEIADPWTGKKRKVDMKPFMVDNSVRIFERGLIALTDKDKILKRQLTSYRIKSFGINGRPIFTDIDEHSVDTLNLALLTFMIEYTDLMKALFKTGAKKANINLDIKNDWADRLKNLSHSKQEETFSRFKNNDRVIYTVTNNNTRNTFGNGKRSLFERKSFR